jgi:PAS domain S-box-containing protein
MADPHPHPPFATAQSDVMAEIGNLLNVGVLTVDEHLVITGWNEWLQRVTGKAAADVIGKTVGEIEPDLRAGARAALERAVNGSVVVMSHALHGFFISAPPASGHEEFERMQQSVRILPLGAGETGLRGAAAFIEDVTERVARENALRAAVEEAQLANQAKTNFLTAMSHELRTPIGAMSGYADLLADGILGPVSESQREHLLRIKSVGAHLLNIVEEILTFARINARREEVQIADADAAMIARDALNVVEPLAAKKGLSIGCHLPAQPIPMATDELKVRQILINLLGNAVKFTERGSIELEVTLRENDGVVSFSVADTGPGIALEDVSRVFAPFTQLETRRFKPHGTGLGLSVSLELARLLGGDLTLVSEVGVGSRFTAVIPIQAPPRV